MAAFRWEKYFTDEGIFIFTQQDKIAIAKLQQTYSDVYLPYLVRLSKEFTPDMAVGQKVYDLLLDVQGIIKNLGMLMDPRLGDAGAKKVVQDLAGSMDSATKEMKWLQKNLKRDEYISESIEAVNKEMETDLKGLADVHKQFQKRLSGIKPATKPKGAVSQMIKTGAPEAVETLQSIGAGLATAFLGPFANIAGILGRGAVGIGKKVRDVRIARKERKRAVEMGRITGIAPDEMYEMLAEARVGTPLGKAFAGGVQQIGEAKAPTETVGRVARKKEEIISPEEIRARQTELGLPTHGGVAAVATRPVAAMPKTRQVAVPAGGELKPLRGRALMNATAPIFFFFDKLAMRAKWTKDVYKFLKKGSAEAGGGGFMDMVKGFLLAKLGPILAIVGAKLAALGPMIIPALLVALKVALVAAVAFIAWQLGTWIRKTFPQIDVFLTGVFTKMFVMWDKFVDTVRQRWVQMMDFFANIGSFISNGIRGIITGIANFYQGIFERLQGIGETVIVGIQGAFGKVSEFFTGIFGTIGKISDKVMQGFSGLTKIWPFNKILKGQGEAATLGGKASPSNVQQTREIVKEQAAVLSEVAPKQIREVIEKIPVVVDSKVLADKVGEFTLKIAKTMEDAMAAFRRTLPETVPVTKQSVDNVYNLRDPLLESLNSGMIGLEE